MTVACGGDDGGGAQCGDLAACGGDVVATWALVDQCVTKIPDGGCGITLVSDNVDVTGTITLNADGTYSQNVISTGSLVQRIPAACFPAQATACSDANNATVMCTGDFTVACECTTTVNDTSTTPGTYTTAGNALTIDGDPATYCVSGSTLSVKLTGNGSEVESILERM